VYRISLLAVVVLASITPALSYCPAPTPRPCFLFHRSAATFIGKVIAERDFGGEAGDKRFDPGIMYTVKVIRQFRGAPARTLQVFTSRNSGGEYLDKGKTYLIFAMAGDAKRPLFIICSLTQIVNDVEATTRMMRRVLQQKGDVTIAGQIDFGGAEEKPVAGAMVEIRGPSGTMQLRTNANGRFKAKVPAGDYTVVARGPHGEPAEQTIYNRLAISPERFSTEPGECVDLWFQMVKAEQMFETKALPGGAK